MTAWIPLLATSVGVVLGALVTVFTQHLQFRRQRMADANRIRLSKLEELFEILCEIQQYYVQLHIEQSHLGLPTELAQMIREQSSPRGKVVGKSIPFPRMQMLITMYAPTLHPINDEVMTIRDTVGNLLIEAISADDLPHAEKKQLWDKWCKATDEMSKTISNARDKVAQLAATMVD